LKPTVRKLGRHDCFDTPTSVDTICCLLPHQLRRSGVEGAFEQSIKFQSDITALLISMPADHATCFSNRFAGGLKVWHFGV
jgi:hypothetical protein